MTLWADFERGNEIRGSLHCAVHDETVSGFARDDDFLWGKDLNAEDMDNSKSSSGMTTGKAAATAKAKSGFLHYAAHDETVSGSGRNDTFIVRFVCGLSALIFGIISFDLWSYWFDLWNYWLRSMESVGVGHLEFEEFGGVDVGALPADSKVEVGAGGAA